MTPPASPVKSPEKGPYTKHGQRALQKALNTISNQDGWVEGLGEVGASLKAWQTAIVNDLGGESEVSAMEMAVVQLATKTFLLLESVDRFLLEQKSIVNKSRRQLFPIVSQRMVLSDGLAKYMGLLGLKKRRKPPASLSEYLTKPQEPNGQPTTTKTTKVTNTEVPADDAKGVTP